MKPSLFNCRMDIWYVLKNQEFNYCNYCLEQLMTDKCPDCRALKRLTRQA